MAVRNKLVRNKIPEYLDSKHIAHTEHIALDAEYEEKLFEKLIEEAKELATDKNPEELADLLEVIEAIKTFQGWNSEHIEAIRLKKKEER